jgi:Protein of unknown function (DUF4199)
VKKTILTFGLISGAISSLLMVAAVPLEDKIPYDKSEILGYTTIVLSFLLVFFGIRSYRDTVCGGRITFAKAFAVGLSITLISSLCYVLAWEVLYFNFLHDFMDKYGAYLIQKAKDTGASPASLQAQLQQVQKYKEMYENPFLNAAITFIEPFPVGLVMTLVFAGILRRKPQLQAAPSPSPAAG